MSSAIAGGLAFATVLTLLLTPALLVLGEQSGQKVKQLLGARGRI
jgi:multidrug efflux pump